MAVVSRSALRSVFLSITSFMAALACAPVFAHHPTGGQLPSTWVNGLLSGLGHPMIGLDHLAFLLALAWLVAKLPLARRVGLSAVFVGGSLLGTALHLQRVNIPVSELLVALSVVAIGGVLVSRKLPPAGVLGGALALAGVLHGYAYGESIVGAETTPLVAYLIGFAVIQLVLVNAVALLVSRVDLPRLERGGLVAGVLVAVAGAYFSFLQLPALA